MSLRPIPNLLNLRDRRGVFTAFLPWALLFRSQHALESLSRKRDISSELVPSRTSDRRAAGAAQRLGSLLRAVSQARIRKALTAAGDGYLTTCQARRGLARLSSC